MPAPAARRPAWLGVLIVAAGSLGVAGNAAGQRADAGAAPARFSANELGLRLARQDGNAAFSPQVVTLPGTGAATLEQDRKTMPFRFEAKDRVALLNELYKIRFFDLPALYATRPVARLSDDGSVDIVMRRLSDADVNSVCVKLAAFEKCVRYGSEAPLELDLLARRVFADAERRAGAR